MKGSVLKLAKMLLALSKPRLRGAMDYGAKAPLLMLYKCRLISQLKEVFSKRQER